MRNFFMTLISTTFLTSVSGACTIMSNTDGIVGDVRGGIVISNKDGVVGHLSGSQIMSGNNRLVGYVSGNNIIRVTAAGNKHVARIDNYQIVTAEGQTVGHGMGCDNVELGAGYLLIFNN
jgi:hypothetical protein